MTLLLTLQDSAGNGFQIITSANKHQVFNGCGGKCPLFYNCWTWNMSDNSYECLRKLNNFYVLLYLYSIKSSTDISWAYNLSLLNKRDKWNLILENNGVNKDV